MFPIPLLTASRLRSVHPGTARVAFQASPRAATERERSRPRPTTCSARADGAAIVAGLLLAAAGLLLSVRAGSGEEWREPAVAGAMTYRADRGGEAGESAPPVDCAHRRYRPGLDHGERKPEGRRAVEFPDFPLLREGEGQVYPQLRLSF